MVVAKVDAVEIDIGLESVRFCDLLPTPACDDGKTARDCKA